MSTRSSKFHSSRRPAKREKPANSRSAAASSRRPVLIRRERKTAEEPARLVAYDLETTRIKAGTPRPLFITAYGDDPLFRLALPVTSLEHLRSIIVTYFLRDDLIGSKFVAWNANNFDAYFVAAALVLGDEYVIRPYLTRSKALRGMRVIVRGDEEKKPSERREWEFLDGIAMMGLPGMSLERMLKIFAPDYQKLTSLIDWSKTEFDSANPAHRRYARRDAEGLYHAVVRADCIVRDEFSRALRSTMGALGIRILTAHLPAGVVLRQPAPADVDAIRQFAARGGYCWCARRFDGLVWKYDLNQAYAAAMREARLPCGYSYRARKVPRAGLVYFARVEARTKTPSVPFYFRASVGTARPMKFSAEEITDTWITSIEVDQLRTEGWDVNVREVIYFAGYFDLRDFVDRLESIRSNCDGGPGGAIGTMIKAIGNMSYGKTLEMLDSTEIVVAKECPDGWHKYITAPEDGPVFDHLWSRDTEKDNSRDYHQPQIGAFITAHVRMVVRRAILQAPESFLYADTDCVIFDRDMFERLDIHPSRYGAWKIECEGEHYRIIAKKVYASADGKTKHAKGLNVKNLASDDFERWLAGEVPVQDQVQRVSFVKVMKGAEMFRGQTRKGTRV